MKDLAQLRTLTKDKKVIDRIDQYMREVETIKLKLVDMRVVAEEVSKDASLIIRDFEYIQDLEREGRIAVEVVGRIPLEEPVLSVPAAGEQSERSPVMPELVHTAKPIHENPALSIVQETLVVAQPLAASLDVQQNQCVPNVLLRNNKQQEVQQYNKIMRYGCAVVGGVVFAVSAFLLYKFFYNRSMIVPAANISDGLAPMVVSPRIVAPLLSPMRCFLFSLIVEWRKKL